MPTSWRLISITFPLSADPQNHVFYSKGTPPNFSRNGSGVDRENCRSSTFKLPYLWKVQDRVQSVAIDHYVPVRLVPESTTLNDLWGSERDSRLLPPWIIERRKKWRNTGYSLVMTPTPCRVAGCIISIRPTYSCAHALFTYTVGSVPIKPAISPKQLKLERTLLLTAYIKLYTGFRLLPKWMTLNDLCAWFKVIYSLNAAKMAKYSLVMTPTPCRVLWEISPILLVSPLI